MKNTRSKQRPKDSPQRRLSISESWLHRDQAKTKLTIRFDPAELKAIQRLAAAQKPPMTASAFVRSTVLAQNTLKGASNG